MSTTYPTATETEEVRPHFLVRTGQFLKKVSNLRPVVRRKSEGKLSTNPDCHRASRSMDLSSKALAEIDVREHYQSFDHGGDSGEDSPYHPPLRSSYALNPRSEPRLNSSPHQLDDPPLVLDTSPLPHVTPTSFHWRAQTLPSQPSPSEGLADAPHSSSTLMRRTLAPRLATLPPPMMAQYAAGGVARLTPSLVTRQHPMPLLNLPTLPMPSPSQSARPVRPTAAPLRSLPALPMRGPSDTDEDADHDNASLDEEEEEEDAEGSMEGAGQGVESDLEESGDEEDGVGPSPPQSTFIANAGPSRLGAVSLTALPQVDTSRFSVSFADAGPHSSTQRTPRIRAQAGPSVDYFSSKNPELPQLPLSPSRTPRPSDFRPKEKNRVVDGVPQPFTVSTPESPNGSPRPGLYHHASKSMVDLMSISRKDKLISPKLARSPPQKSQALGILVPSATKEGPPLSGAELPDDVITSPMLRRRRSLPVYEPNSDPPPYPDLLFRRRGQAPRPHEEEGRECLPQYSNAIHLAGIMPRKMEFTQPGIQAKDRKWRRMYCVLEGTCFRVYKCPPAASGVSAIEHWWENKVGVGDLTSVNVTAMTASGIRVSAARDRRRESGNMERVPKIAEDDASSTRGAPSQERATELPPRSRDSSPHPPSTKSVLGLTSRFLRRQRSKSISRLGVNSSGSSSRLSMDSRLDSNTRRPSHPTSSRHSMDTVASSRPSNASSVGTHFTTSTAVTVPSPLSTSPTSSNDSGSRFSRSRFRSYSNHHQDIKLAEKDKEKDVSFTPDSNDLVHQYSLQNAESGLASDYLKRKNVIRVRMEGEQFLLQAKDVAAVIDWIEGIQMGTNVAPDLDERPMPKGPIFPRRRRRRPRRPEPAGASVAS